MLKIWITLVLAVVLLLAACNPEPTSVRTRKTYTYAPPAALVSLAAEASQIALLG